MKKALTIMMVTLMTFAARSAIAGPADIAGCICNRLPCLCVGFVEKRICRSQNTCPIEIDPLSVLELKTTF